MSSATLTDEQRLVQRANAYLALGRAFGYQPLDAEGLLGALEDTGSATALQQVEEALDELEDSDLGPAEEYTFLFERQAPAPPYATSYRLGVARVFELQALAEFYRTFGFRIAETNPELADHIGAELEFLGLLLAKEAYARATGLPEAADVCRDARARFVGEHLAPWLPRLHERLLATARLRYYPALAHAALELVADEPRRVVQDTTGLEDDGIAPAVDDPTRPFVCSLVEDVDDISDEEKAGLL